MTLGPVFTRPRAWPGITEGADAGLFISNRTTVDASGEYHTLIIMALEDMVVSHIGFRPATVSGSGTLDMRIETVDASTGAATGTLWATDTNIAGASLTSNTFAAHALTAAATIAKGSVFALVFAYNSGTSVQIPEVGGGGNAAVAVPYSWVNTGTPTKGAFNTIACGLGSSATSFYPIFPLRPVSATSAQTYNNTSDARRGIRFQLPFKCRAWGARIVVGVSVTGDFDIVLRDDAGSALATTSIDRSQLPGGNSNPSEIPFLSAQPTLDKDSWYRLTLEPTSATNIGWTSLQVANQAIRSGLPGGTRCHLTTYTSGGGWVDTATDQVPFIDLLYDQLDDGAGGGGVATPLFGGGVI